MEQRRYSAPALEKGLDIIELLSTEERGLSQSEIARRMGRSVGEIFRMLVVLTERGYVVQDGDTDRYGLTTKLFEVANNTPLINRLTAVAGPIMRRLTHSINQSAHLGIASDDAILIIGQVDPPGNMRMGVRLGARVNFWRASTGRVILAFSEEETLKEFFVKIALPDGMNEGRLREEFGEIRARGHEITDSFTARGIVNIAAPVIDHTGNAVAGLTVPHLERYDDPISFQTCAAELIDAANAISSALGGPNVPRFEDTNPK
ncbi:MAG: IclR family transcriptional regulator [Paracoccaceae bacterium]|nr:IclR family transcriptional regulator [Paracoccaceae bacterium]